MCRAVNTHKYPPESPVPQENSASVLQDSLANSCIAQILKNQESIEKNTSLPVDEEFGFLLDRTDPIDASRTAPLQFFTSLFGAPVASSFIRIFPSKSVFKQGPRGWSITTQGGHSFQMFGVSLLQVKIPEVLNITEDKGNLTFSPPIEFTIAPSETEELNVTEDKGNPTFSPPIELTIAPSETDDSEQMTPQQNSSLVMRFLSVIRRIGGDRITLLICSINQGSDSKHRSLRIQAGRGWFSLKLPVSITLDVLCSMFLACSLEEELFSLPGGFEGMDFT